MFHLPKPTTHQSSSSGPDAQTPVPPPEYPKLNHHTPLANTPVASSQNHNGRKSESTGSQPGGHKPSKPASPSQGPLRTQVASVRRAGTRMAVVLSSPATPMEYMEMDDADDSDDVDELILSDLDPQYKKRVADAQKTAAKLKARQTAAAPKATTLVALPKTTTPAAAPKTLAAGAAAAERRMRATPSQGSSKQTPKPTNSKGRPPGWVPGLSYADVRKLGAEAAAHKAGIDLSKVPQKMPRQTRPRAAGTPSGGVPKRRGRRPRLPSPTPAEIFRNLKPRFVSYLCEWEGCNAELHNLLTLRRHVGLVHLPTADPWVCSWGKCATRKPKKVFGHYDELSLHMEQRHMLPFGWHVGEGPVVACPTVVPEDTSQELPDYLFDKEGNQVTPSVRDQQVEDLATRKARRRKLRELLQKMSDALPDEEE